MNAWNTLYTVALIVLGILILLCLLRVFRGPRTADRLMGVNMITTLVILVICILSLLLKEEYLTDVALIFSMLGCLAVVVLTRILSARNTADDQKRSESKPQLQSTKGGKA